MSKSFEEKFCFANVEVDIQANLITIAGKQKRLEPKLINLLSYLAKHSGQVVTRQQITAAVWPGVVVGDESITQAIFLLRNVLGDDAKRPRYIETISKKGYRFLADVRIIEPQSATPLLPTTHPSQWRGASVIAGLSMFFVLICAWYLLRPNADYEIANILPVTKMPGAEYLMAINNHRKMAFVSLAATGSDLYVKDLTSGIQDRITQDHWDKGQPSWLDDDTLIYPRCVGHSDRECQIVQQDLNESPRVLYESKSYIREVALIPNSNSIIFNDETQRGLEPTFFDLQSGKLEKLRDAYPDLPADIFYIKLSKDAKQLFFVNIAMNHALMALNFSTKEIRVVTDMFAEITDFTFNHQQQLVIAGTHNSTAGLWLLDTDGGHAKTIIQASGSEHFLSPLTDPDEQAIYYHNVQHNRDVGVVFSEKEISADMPDLNSMATDAWAVLSKDEQFLYFVSNRTGFYEIWSYDLNKKQSKRITQTKSIAEIRFVSLANNGQRICVKYEDNGQPTLGIFSVHNGELLMKINSPLLPLNWSRDDTYIYAVDYTNPTPVLTRYDTYNMTATRIQENAGLFAQESTDGSSIKFIDYEKNALVEREIATQKDKTLINFDIKLREVLVGRMRLDATETSLFLIQQNRDIHQLWQYPLQSQDSKPRKLMDLPKDTWVTYINNQGTKVFSEKHMPQTGDIMKIELR